MNHVELFFALLAGHFLADFGLQTEFMSKTKGQAFVKAIGFYTLTGHAAIQGLVLGAISRNFKVGIIIFVTHWVIDFSKASVLITDKFPHTKGARKNGQAQGFYGINIDQALHVLAILGVVLFVA